MTFSRGIVFLFLLALGCFTYLFAFSGGNVVMEMGTDSPVHRIIFELRLPRLLCVLAVGAVLSAIGASYQVLFRNPLAEPYVLGISSSVTLAAACGETLFGFASRSILGVALAICIAGLTSMLLLRVGKNTFRQATERIILFGMGINFVFSALLFLLLSYIAQQLGGSSMRWLFGQIPWPSMETAVALSFFGAVVCGVLTYVGPVLDALACGDTVARTLGVSPEKSRNFLVLFTSTALGVFVTQTGSIGFVGLVVPHIARLVFRPHSSRLLILNSILIGALFLLISDFLSRSLLPPMEFPIGTITTVVGGPLFLWLLWNR